MPRTSTRALVTASLMFGVSFFCYCEPSVAGPQGCSALVGLTGLLVVVVALVVSPAILRAAHGGDVESH